MAGQRRDEMQAGECQEIELAREDALRVLALLPGKLLPLVDRHHQRAPGVE